MTKPNSDFVSKYGPWALVTGASGGIGREIATLLASNGCNVVLVARRTEELTKLSEELRSSFGVDALPLPADLATELDAGMVLEQIKDLEIGLYVANAGFGTAGQFVDIAPEQELNMIDVNCRALTALAHPLAQKMKSRSCGGMIFLSSIVAFQGVGNSVTYAATKAFVQSFAEGLAIELGPHGIDVLSSAPGPVGTEFAKRADMQMGAAASPLAVAKATLGALGRARTTRPGFQSKLLGYGLGSLPRRMRSMILTKVMSGMTKHRDEKQKA